MITPGVVLTAFLGIGTAVVLLALLTRASKRYSERTTRLAENELRSLQEAYRTYLGYRPSRAQEEAYLRLWIAEDAYSYLFHESSFKDDFFLVSEGAREIMFMLTLCFLVLLADADEPGGLFRDWAVVGMLSLLALRWGGALVKRFYTRKTRVRELWPGAPHETDTEAEVVRGLKANKRV